ncbi:MAG: sugar phosphate nucleotidyltransferase [Vicinamibacterales bacterium]
MFVVLKIRRALVLTAGLGTRLRPLTDVRAKPAIPVAGQPMVRRIAAWLVSGGVDDLVLNLHHRPETLTACVGDGRDLGARVRYSWEMPAILGSAGGPRLARAIVGADTFFIVNGDTLTDVDLAQLADAHAASGALVTLALVPNREFQRYGGVHLDTDGRVTGFVRRGPAARGSYHYIGVQIVSARAFDDVQPGTAASSIGGVYDAWIAAQPGAIRGVVSDAAFHDVGTPADYWRTSLAFALAEGTHGSTVGAAAQIDSSARVTQSILWDHVRVGANARLDECIVTDGVTVPGDAAYRRAILLSGADGQPIASPLSL